MGVCPGMTEQQDFRIQANSVNLEWDPESPSIRFLDKTTGTAVSVSFGRDLMDSVRAVLGDYEALAFSTRPYGLTAQEDCLRWGASLVDIRSGLVYLRDARHMSASWVESPMNLDTSVTVPLFLAWLRCSALKHRLPPCGVWARDGAHVLHDDPDAAQICRAHTLHTMRELLADRTCPAQAQTLRLGEDGWIPRVAASYREPHSAMRQGIENASLSAYTVPPDFIAMCFGSAYTLLPTYKGATGIFRYQEGAWRLVCAETGTEENPWISIPCWDRWDTSHVGNIQQVLAYHCHHVEHVWERGDWEGSVRKGPKFYYKVCSRRSAHYPPGSEVVLMATSNDPSQGELSWSVTSHTVPRLHEQVRHAVDFFWPGYRERLAAKKGQNDGEAKTDAGTETETQEE